MGAADAASDDEDDDDDDDVDDNDDDDDEDEDDDAGDAGDAATTDDAGAGAGAAGELFGQTPHACGQASHIDAAGSTRGGGLLKMSRNELLQYPPRFSIRHVISVAGQPCSRHGKG